MVSLVQTIRVWEHKSVKKNNMLILFQPTTTQGVTPPPPLTKLWHVKILGESSVPKDEIIQGAPQPMAEFSCNPVALEVACSPQRPPTNWANKRSQCHTCQQELGRLDEVGCPSGWIRWVGLGRLLSVSLRPGRLSVGCTLSWKGGEGGDEKWDGIWPKWETKNFKSTKLKYSIQVRCMVYLPTWMVDVYAYGLKTVRVKRFFMHTCLMLCQCDVACMMNVSLFSWGMVRVMSTKLRKLVGWEIAPHWWHVTPLRNKVSLDGSLVANLILDVSNVENLYIYIYIEICCTSRNAYHLNLKKLRNICTQRIIIKHCKYIYIYI